MTFTVHASDNIRPPCLLHINLAFSKVIASYEEGCFGIEAGENIEQMARKIEWTIIEGQRDIAIIHTMVDAFTVVGDIANERSRYMDCGFAEGYRVCIAAVAEGYLTCWARAVVEASSAVTTRRATVMQPLESCQSLQMTIGLTSPRRHKILSLVRTFYVC